MEGSVLVLFWIVFGALTGWVASLLTDRTTLRSSALFIILAITVSCAVGLLLYTFKPTIAQLNAVSYLVIPTVAASLILLIVSKLDDNNF